MKSLSAAICLLCLAFALFFLKLGDRALWSSDEGRYAEIPREMIERSDAVSPHLNHVPYFEKPPLVYWLTAVNFSLMGETEGAARFWPALLGVIGVVLVWLFACRWFDRETGFWSAWFLLTSIGYFLVGRYLVLDMPFTVLLSAGLLCFLEGFEGRNRLVLIAAYLLIGLATLVKGVVACAFPFLIVAVYLTWTRQWGRWRQTGILWGVPLVLAVNIPWFVLISMKNPTFLQFFFIHEHLQRFLTHNAGRPGPIYYFFGIGMLFFFPWSLFVFFIGDRLCTYKSPVTMEDRRRLFLLIWLLVIFLFFSVSRSKLPPYILPVLPPLAILTGYWAKHLFDFAPGRYPRIVPIIFEAAFCAICIGTAGLVTYLQITAKPEKIWIEHFIYMVVGLFAVGSGIAFLLSLAPWKRNLTHKASVWLGKSAFLAWGLTIVLAYPIVILAMERLDPLQSTKEMAQTLKGVLKPEDTLAVYDGYEAFSDLPFYLKRRVMLVGTNIGELTYGSRIGDQKAWFQSVEDFQDHLKRAAVEGKNVYCVVKKKKYNELVEKGIRNMDILLRSPKGIVLVQRAGAPACTGSAFEGQGKGK